MKVVILCGGKGTRLQEVTRLIPKPLVEVGGRPMLWHIMKYYSHFGFNDFVLCLGYKSWLIKEFFLNYDTMTSDVEVKLGEEPHVKVHRKGKGENWRITLAETGEETMTAARVKRVEKYLKDDSHFMLTYGDGLGDIDLPALVKFHKKHGKLGTVSGIHAQARFGELTLKQSSVRRFAEKPQATANYINGGFFVFRREFLDRLEDREEIPLERQPLASLATDDQLECFRHDGFWMPMDTPREHDALNDMWASGKAPWKVWE